MTDRLGAGLSNFFAMLDAMTKHSEKHDINKARQEAAKSALKYALISEDEVKIKSTRDELVAAYTEAVDLTVESSRKLLESTKTKDALQKAVDKGTSELRPGTAESESTKGG